MPSNLHAPVHVQPRPQSRLRRALQLILLLTPLCTLLFITSLYAQGDINAPSPSGAPTGVPSGVAPQVFVPWVVAAPPDTTPHLEGQLTLGNAPLTGALLELRQCADNAPGAEVVLTATTNLLGYYHADLPVNPVQIAPTATVSYALTLLAAPPITATATITEVPFAQFKSRCLPSGGSSGGSGAIKRLLPALDLAAPQVITPSQAITVDMPVNFGWYGRNRHASNESYQWHGSVQFDCGSCAPVIITSQPLTFTATAIEWCSIAPHSSGATDVKWVDYFLRISNALGTGDTATRRVNIGVTTHECPPLP